MTAYTPDREAFFFGRDGEMAEVISQLQRTGKVALVGPSGSGKSSLVAAGVAPALVGGGWSAEIIRPGRNPAAALDAARRRLDESGSTGPRLLVVDQLEEVFMQSETESWPFLSSLVDDASGQRLAVTVRADFFGRCMTSPLWPLVRDHRFDVLPLDGDQIESAVVSACEKVGVYVEPALVDRLRADAADEPGRLPLLQETMVLLWERLERRFLPLRAYEAIVLPRTAYGREPRTGLQVALARHADATMASLPEDERPLARRVLVRLVQFGDGRPDVRRQRMLSELQAGEDDPELVERVVRRLDEARLVTLGAGSEPDAAPVVDLAHEAIISAWPEMGDLLREHRAAEHQRRWLEQRASEWVASGRAGALLDEVQLPAAEAWLAGPDAAVVGAGPIIREFVQASRRKIDAESRRRAVTARRLRRLAIALSVALVLSVAAASVAAVLAARARDSRIDAHAAALAQAAGAQPPARTQLGLLLGAAGQQLQPGPTTDGGLLGALATNPQVRRVTDVGLPVLAMAVVPSSTLLVVATQSGPVQLIDMASGRVVDHLELPAGAEARSVAASPDATHVAVGTSDGRLLDWTLTGSAVGSHREFRRPSSVRALAYSPDSTHLAVGLADGGVNLLSLETRQFRELERHDDWVNTVCFTPDGSELLSGSGEPGVDRDTRILVHDLARQQSTRIFTGHRAAVRSMDVTAAGSSVASSDGAGRVLLWNPSDLQITGTLDAHKGRAYTVAFAPDEARLFSGGGDHAVRVWDAATTQPVGVSLLGHALAVRALIPLDQDRLVTGGTDGQIVVWDLARRPYPRLTTTLDDQRAVAVAGTGDGALVATGSVDGRVVIRDGVSGLPTGTEIHLDAAVKAMAFSVTGDELVTADRTGRLAVWRALDGRLLGERRDVLDTPQDDWILSVATGPDGSIATGDTTPRIRIWRWDGSSLVDGPALDSPASWVTGVAFVDSERLMSVDAAGRAALWELTGGQPTETVVATGLGQLTAVATTSTGLAVMGDADDRVLTTPVDPPGPAPPASWLAHTGDVVAIAVMGNRVATGDRDGTLALWTMVDDQLVATGPPLELGQPVLSAAFGLGSRTLYTALGEQGTLRWDVDPQSWRSLACGIATRDLTPLERAPYAPDLDDTEVCER